MRNVQEDFDWESYLEDNYSVRRVSGKNGLEIRICCPACGETKYKCYVNPSRNAFYCFKCDFRTGSRYNLLDFVAITENITKGQALLRLVREYKPVAPEEPSFTFGDPTHNSAVFLDANTPHFPEMKHISGLPEEAVKLEVEEGNKYWEYVKSRGFTEEHLRATNLHYIPDRRVPFYDSEGKFRGNLGNRIVIPIYGQDGALVSWLARTISSGESHKYLNAPGSDLSKTVWPFSLPYPGAPVVLVEGVIDALGVRQVPDTAAYATFGKRISKEQIQLLKCWGVQEVVLWYDKKDAHKEMISEVERLKMHFREVYVLDLSNWPKDKDPGSFLSDTQGTAMIKDTLEKRISVYSLEYEQWKMAF